jgi:hypothetical protein
MVEAISSYNILAGIPEGERPVWGSWTRFN